MESTKAVNALFDSLFDLVRLDSGKIKLTIEPVELGKLLKDLDDSLRKGGDRHSPSEKSWAERVKDLFK